MSYQQLTEGQRYQISVLRTQSMSVSAMARAIGVHRSTLYRELRRNSQDGYQPDYAQQQARFRRTHARKARIPNCVLPFVELALSWRWSPEQISAIGKRIGLRVSHEWIYRYVAANKAQGGQLYRYLRQGHKRYRKGSGSRCSPIKDARSIEERPAIVDSRERFGDWEADTVLGKQGTGVLVTLAERKSRHYLVKRVRSKQADEVRDAIIEMLRPYAKHVHTITFDNGGEFAGHKAIEAALEAKTYFAHPYSSWERGLNENFNGLLRQYIPKGTDLRAVTDEEIEQAQRALNLRPRKCLGFRQPGKVFEEYFRAA